MNTTANPYYMTVRDVSEFLNVSKTKVYELTNREDFPVCRFGGSIRIPRDPFLAWVESKTRISTALRAEMRAG